MLRGWEEMEKEGDLDGLPRALQLLQPLHSEDGEAKTLSIQASMKKFCLRRAIVLVTLVKGI